MRISPHHPRKQRKRKGIGYRFLLFYQKKSMKKDKKNCHVSSVRWLCTQWRSGSELPIQDKLQVNHNRPMKISKLMLLSDQKKRREIWEKGITLTGGGIHINQENIEKMPTQNNQTTKCFCPHMVIVCNNSTASSWFRTK